MWRLPALPFFAVSYDLSNFLKAQKVMVPTMFLMVLLNSLSVLLSWLLISPQPTGFGLGFKGGPIALSIAQIIQVGVNFCSHVVLIVSDDYFCASALP